MTFQLGRTVPLYPPRLHLRSYFSLQEPLPAAPAAVDDSVKASKFLAQILGNDRLGDCTVAAAVHIAGMVIANANAPIPPSLNTKDTVAWYRKLTGGPDSGLDEITVLNAWKKGTIMPNHKIAGYVGVSGSKQAEIEFSQWAFGNTYFALAMPDAWINPFPRASGFVWDVAGAPNLNNGHAFCGTGYASATGVKIDTWGMEGTLTWAAIVKYFDGRNGQVYTVLSQDVIDKATQLAPSGFAFAQLTTDLASLT